MVYGMFYPHEPNVHQGWPRSPRAYPEVAVRHTVQGRSQKGARGEHRGAVRREVLACGP